MADEKWIKEELWVLDCLQKYIDLYCFDSEIFKAPEDITGDNLKEFLETILRHFQYYHITVDRIMDLGDALEIYFYRNNYEENDEGRPIYPKTDRRELTFYVFNKAIAMYTNWNILQEEVPFILRCLNAPEEQIINMYGKLDSYFEQFDPQARNAEDRKRYVIINQQRIEAISKNQPVPIKPMGMKLDSCYKKSVTLSA